MKIIYVTRHFNHSGFFILKKLIDEKIPVAAVLLHNSEDPWRKPMVKYILRYLYYLKCWFYRCKPLRTLRSEEDLAKQHKIPIIWTDSIKSDRLYNRLQEIEPDLLLLGGGWHELIPKRIFSLPRLGCINTHPSLLPEFRGTSITRWQVMHGVSHSGSTIHFVDDTFDTGGVLAQQSIEVHNDVTPQELFYELGRIGADLMVPLLKKFQQGKPESFLVQHNSKYYNYYKKWEWDIKRLKINWMDSFERIHFKVLANTQESFEYKGPYFEIDGDKYFLRRTALVKSRYETRDVLRTPTAGEIYVEKIQSDEIQLSRKGDPFSLILISVQKFDKWYRLRRSYRANKLLKLKPYMKFDV